MHVRVDEPGQHGEVVAFDDPRTVGNRHLGTRTDRTDALALDHEQRGFDGIASGAVGWTTLTLPRGRYELVCNLTNHYANRMYQELDVT